MDEPLNEFSRSDIVTPLLPLPSSTARRSKPTKDKSHDLLGRWLDRYLRACGVADHAVRTRLTRYARGDSRKKGSALGTIDEFNIAKWQEHVDRILTREHRVDAAISEPSLIPGRVLVRNSESFRACGIAADRTVAPTEAPALMEPQDISSGSLMSLLREALRPRYGHRWSAQFMTLIIAIVG